MGVWRFDGGLSSLKLGEQTSHPMAKKEIRKKENDLFLECSLSRSLSISLSLYLSLSLSLYLGIRSEIHLGKQMGIGLGGLLCIPDTFKEGTFAAGKNGVVRLVSICGRVHICRRERDL